MRFIFATDLHGDRRATEQVFAFALSNNVDAVVLGGDLTPKNVAVRLPTGEILSTKLLTQCEHDPTYTTSLRKIKAMECQGSPEEYVASLERSGYIIHEAASYHDYVSMLEEQRLLRKLYRFFSDENPHLTFNDDELLMVREIVVPLMEHHEAQFTDQVREAFTRRINRKKSEFDRYRPSRWMERLILCEMSKKSLAPFFHSLEVFLEPNELPIAKAMLQLFNQEKIAYLDALPYRSLIEPLTIASLVRFSAIAKLKDEAEATSTIHEGQTRFLSGYLFPLLAEWKEAHPDIPVYAMLGNDDAIQLVDVLEEAHGQGVLTHIHNRVVPFGTNLQLAGYGYVSFLPPHVEYKAWLRNEDEIYGELHGLYLTSSGKPTIWSIHEPPYGCLDCCTAGNMGSECIRSFLLRTQPSIALFGHIHEAPRLCGRITDNIGRTLCVNPGAEHENGLQAAIIDTETRSVERIQGEEYCHSA